MYSLDRKGGRKENGISVFRSGMITNGSAALSERTSVYRIQEKEGDCGEKYVNWKKSPYTDHFLLFH